MAIKDYTYQQLNRPRQLQNICIAIAVILVLVAIILND